MRFFQKKRKKINSFFLFLFFTVFLSNSMKAQLVFNTGTQYPPEIYACGTANHPDVTLAALGSFSSVTPNGDGTVTQCIDLQADYGIDPTTVTDTIIVSLFYDLGFNSAEFSTSNGYTIPALTNPPQGGTYDHFAYGLLPNDGSGQICVTVDATNAGMHDVSFYATIPHGMSSVGIVSTGFIDNEIINNDDPDRNSECEVGTFPIGSNGTANDLMDVTLTFTMSEVEMGDSRTISLTFEACGVIYDEVIDPEPHPSTIGVATISIDLLDVPADCNELSYSFCSNAGEQSYGVGGITIVNSCTFPDLNLTKEVSTNTASIGDTVTYTLTVLNEGSIEATGVEVTDMLPAGLSYISDDGGGNYNNQTGLWLIGNVASGASTTLNIDVIVENTGAIFNESEITAINEGDIDSVPNNDEPDEDDIDNACLSVPIEICSDETISVELMAFDMATYQWYLDGVVIPGATSQSYTATAAGTYTYAVDGAGLTGDCSQELCCPIVIELIECCDPNLCLPILITKN